MMILVLIVTALAIIPTIQGQLTLNQTISLTDRITNGFFLNSALLLGSYSGVLYKLDGVTSSSPSISNVTLFDSAFTSFTVYNSGPTTTMYTARYRNPATLPSVGISKATLDALPLDQKWRFSMSEVNLVLNDNEYFYIIGYDSAAIQLARVPISATFDNATLKNEDNVTLLTDVTLNQDTRIITGQISQGYLYAATPLQEVIEIDLVDLELKTSKVSPVRNISLNYDNCVFDTPRNLSYFVLVDDNGASADIIVKFDLSTFKVVAELDLSDYQIQGTTSAVLDPQLGQLYCGTGTGSSVVYQISVPTMTVVEQLVVSLDVPYMYSSAVFDSNTGSLFFVQQNVQGNFSLAQIDPAPACKDNCNDRGYCVYASCNCTAIPDKNRFPKAVGYGGADCSTLACLNNCNRNGVCLGSIGECKCDATHTGDDCSILRCPNDCSGNGVCESLVCKCDRTWFGDDCSQGPAIPCDMAKDCDECSTNSSCGWCASTQKCMIGSIVGPEEAACLDWYYQTCPETVMYFFGAFFTGIAALLLLINMISLCYNDGAVGSEEQSIQIRGSWWRNQRSAKAWHLIDQIQFTAITGQFAVQIPSLYANFITVSFYQMFRWSIFGFALPWRLVSQDQPDLESSRQTLSMDQYNSEIRAVDTESFFGSLFWLGVLTAVVCSFFLVVRLFAKSEATKAFVRNRFWYSLLRLIMFAYFPFAVLTTYTLTLKSAGSAIISALFLFFVHIGLLAFILWIIPRDKKRSGKLFQASFLNKFGCLYSSFYFRRSWYMIVILLRKLITGAIVGFAHNSKQSSQLIGLLVVEGVYLAQLVFIKPYLDSLHMFLDVLTTVFRIFVIAFMFAFLNSITDKTVHLIFTILATLFLMLSFVICIAVYINSWLKMRNINSLPQLIARLRGLDNANDPVNDTKLTSSPRPGTIEIELDPTDKLD